MTEQVSALQQGVVAQLKCAGATATEREELIQRSAEKIRGLEQALREANEQFARSHAELEQRIRQRTAELIDGLLASVE